MPLRDRFRRLRKGSISADNSPPATLSPEISTGEATPAVTRTPTAQSATDLTTIGEVLTHKATLKAEAEGKKKKRGLFKWKQDPYKDWPADVYKPHEVPAPKYRRAPDPKHIENLSNFSFGNTADRFMRRLSQQSAISPGGSRWTSRAGSRINSIAPSRNASVAEEKEDSGVGSPKEGPLRPTVANRGSHKPPVKGQEPAIGKIGEDDEDASMSRQRTVEADKENILDAAKTHSTTSNDMPFTQQELTHALKKASIKS